MYAEINIPKQITNVRTILGTFPKDIKNVAICYLLDNTVKGMLEALLNDLDQASNLLDKALKDLGYSDGLDLTDEIRETQRMRDKLLAHRMEVLVSTDRHLNWYKEKYGSYDRAFDLVERASEQLGDIAREVSRHPNFQRVQASVPQPPLLDRQDIELLLAALKKANIY